MQGWTATTMHEVTKKKKNKHKKVKAKMSVNFGL